MTVFGDRAFKEVAKGKTGSPGWALIQEDWCPYHGRTSGHTDTRDVLSQRKGHQTTQKEGGLRQAQERPLGKPALPKH